MVYEYLMTEPSGGGALSVIVKSSNGSEPTLASAVFSMPAGTLKEITGGGGGGGGVLPPLFVPPPPPPSSAACAQTQDRTCNHAQRTHVHPASPCLVFIRGACRLHPLGAELMVILSEMT